MPLRPTLPIRAGCQQAGPQTIVCRSWRNKNPGPVESSTGPGKFRRARRGVSPPAREIYFLAAFSAIAAWAAARRAMGTRNGEQLT